MSNFTYNKYQKLVSKLENSLEKLKNVNEENYYSYEVEDVGRSLISMGNSLVMYIRHLEEY